MIIRISDLMDLYEAEPYPMTDPHPVSGERITELTMKKLGLDKPAVKTTKKVRISDLMDSVEDDTVPIEVKEIVSPERITELTMAKLHADIDNNETDRKKLSKGALAAIILAACLVLSVTAYATGLISRRVNWQGETVGEEEVVTMTPPPSGVEESDRFERANAILDDADSMEFVLVKYTDENGIKGIKGKGFFRGPYRTLRSMEELEAALAENGSELQVFKAPAGYEFCSAQVLYDCTEGYEYTLVSKETDDNGLTVERYSIPDDGIVISGYMIDFRNADGDRMFIMGTLLSTDVEFTIQEDDTVTSIPVDGMDSALMMEQTDVYGTVSASLQMSKALTVPIPYVERAVFSGAFPTQDDVFKTAWYSVHTDSMDSDTLLAWITDAQAVVG